MSVNADLNADLEEIVSGLVALRPMLAVCPEPGCTRLTMGGTCVEHDVPTTVTYPRGRPFVPEALPVDEHLAAPV